MIPATGRGNTAWGAPPVQAAREDLKHHASQLIALEHARLELPMLSLAGKVRDGNVEAIHCWIKLFESRRRLLGLDAPKQLHVVDEEDVEFHRLVGEILKDPQKRIQADRLLLCEIQPRHTPEEIRQRIAQSDGAPPVLPH